MEPIAPVMPSAAPRHLPLDQGGLTVGQVVRARVMRIDGGTVQLQWGEQTVSVASRVPLDIGQQVNLLVEEGSAGKILLRMLDDTLGGRRLAVPPPQPLRSGNPSPTRAGGPTSPLPRSSSADAATPTGRASSGRMSAPNVTGLVSDDLLALSSLLGERLDPTLAHLTGLPRLATAGPAETRSGPPVPDPAGPAPAGMPRPGVTAPPPVPAGTTRPGDGAPPTAPTGTTAGARPTQPDHVARAAMPAYGKLARSVGGAGAIATLLASLGHEARAGLARAPLAPADLGRLLVEIGLHPDEMNAVLVGEMLAQGNGVDEADIRGLRRELAAAGGTQGDAASAVLLSRLRLPLTPLSLAVARQALAGQLDPRGAWADVLRGLQTLAREPRLAPEAAPAARELLGAWRVPVDDGGEQVARWLQSMIDEAGMPPEAKIARAPRADGDGALVPLRPDMRDRLDTLARSIGPRAPGEAANLRQSLQRLGATVAAEQVLNGAGAERAEPRFFAVTLPAIVGHHAHTLELRVRERDARPEVPGEAARPDVVQLRLSLPGLGDLGIVLKIAPGGVACQFSTSSSFTEALIEASRSELTGRIEQLGYPRVSVQATHEAVVPIETDRTSTPRVSRVDLQA